MSEAKIGKPSPGYHFGAPQVLWQGDDMKPLTIEQERRGNLDVLHLDGSLDSNAFNRLERVLQALGEERRHRVILDCTGLTYISSVNIGTLMSFARTASEHGGELKLASVSPNIVEVISMLGFHRFLAFYKDTDKAIEAFWKG